MVITCYIFCLLPMAPSYHRHAACLQLSRICGWQDRWPPGVHLVLIVVNKRWLEFYWCFTLPAKCLCVHAATAGAGHMAPAERPETQP